MLNDHGASDAMAGIPQKVFEQSELLRSQFNPLSRTFHPSLDTVEFEVSDPQHGFRSYGVAPQQGAYTR